MKKIFVITLVVLFGFVTAGLALASEKKANPLRAQEKGIHANEFSALIPADKKIGVDQFKKIYDEVMAGKRKAYLIDVRTHPEFYAFHIEGTDHVHAGHMYTIPKKIKDPNAEIVIWCRTSHRAQYVAGFLYKYGYKNVYCYMDGVVGWAKAGHPFVNQFTGKFVITEYRKTPSDAENSFRIREFHPY
jgi:rhodanese-related sulfurtransferase